MDSANEVVVIEQGRPTRASREFKAELRALTAALGSSGAGPADLLSSGDLCRTLSELLTGGPDVESVLRFSLRQAADEVQADRAFICQVDDKARATFTAVEGEANSGRLLAQTREVVEWVCRNRLTLRSQGDPAEPRVTGLAPGSRLLAVPICNAHELLGLVYLERAPERAAFSDREVAKIEGLAAYSCLAITNSRFVSQITGQVRKYQNINEVSLAISAILQLDELLDLILERCLALTDGQQGYIFLGEGESLTCLASRDSAGKGIAEVEISRSILDRCIEESAPICILDTHDDETNLSASVMALDLRSVMAVPLVANQHHIGALYISSQAIAKTFSEQDKSLLEAIANQAALAIRNAQLVKEQEHQIVELERALELVKEAQRRAVTDGLTGLYNHVYFKEQLYGSVLEAQRYGQPLSIVILDLDHFKRINDTYGHRAGDEILQHAARICREAIRDCDLLARYGGEEIAFILPQTDRSGALIVADRVRSSLCAAPAQLSSGQEVTVTASLGVASHKHGWTATELFERADRALYVAKSNGRNGVWADGSTVAMPIDAMRQVRERTQEAFMDTVRALAEAVDAKDRYTGGHLRHVQAMVRHLGRELGLSEREVQEVELTAIMHDVGKIGIPDAILQKPAPLDDDEWVVMRTHPVLGARILQAGNLGKLAIGIRHHHERWDGQGYPDGLEGARIPLASRIVSVVDAWGAMTTDRVYRRSIGVERALVELKANAGTQFDPEVVAAFVRIMERRLAKGIRAEATAFGEEPEESSES